MKVTNNLNTWDSWSVTHFAGCMMISMLVFYVALIIHGYAEWIYRLALIIACGAGLVWEILDDNYRIIRPQLNLEQRYVLDRIFDPRGASVLDFACDIAGALVGNGTIYLITIL